MNPELIAYEILVSRLASSKSPIVYYNSGYEHAAIVVNNIFKNSTKNIKILTGSFDEQVCSDSNFLYSLEMFLLQKGKFDVIINEVEKLNDNNKVLQLLKQYPNNVSISTTKQKIINGKEIHFLTSDDKMYRLEYNTNLFKAEFSFNNEENTKDLNKTFDELKNKSIKFEL